MAHGPRSMTHLRRRAGTSAVLAGLTIAAFAAASASAATPTAPAPAPKPAGPTFSVTPVGSSGALLLHGTPGRVLHGAVRVHNTTGHTITVVLRRADVRNASNGNADYDTSSGSGTGGWLRLATTDVRLAPRASRDVAFTATVPTTATGASHYAGIVAVDAKDLASAAGKGGKKRSFSFNRVTRQALPLTIRLPGPLTRSLALRSAAINVQPVGAGLILNLLPGGTELIQSATIRLRVTRGSTVVLRSTAGLGQLFPGEPLAYRIPWRGKPTKGSYQVSGVITPRGAAPISINQQVTFTPAKAAALKQATPALPGTAASSSMPMWVWIALAAGAAGLLALLITVWKLARRPLRPVA